MDDSKNGKKTSGSPDGMKAFDQTMRGLVKVPKSELDAEEKKWQGRKKARRARRQA